MALSDPKLEAGRRPVSFPEWPQALAATPLTAAQRTAYCGVQSRPTTENDWIMGQRYGLGVGGGSGWSICIHEPPYCL